jgi:hypothetical protein
MSDPDRTFDFGQRGSGGYGSGDYGSGGYGSGGYGAGGHGAGGYGSGSVPPPDTGGGSTAAYTDPYAVGQPPVLWLIGAAVLAVVCAVAAAILGTSPQVAFAAWVGAGPVAIGLLAAFSVQDTAQRARPVYSAQPWTRVLYWAVVVLAFIGIGISAWQLALWAGRL